MAETERQRSFILRCPSVTNPIYSLRELWPQWAAALLVYVLNINMGLVAGWTSPYLARLTSGDELLVISSSQASWVASLVPLGRLIGAVVGSLCVEFYGSKKCIFVTGLPLMIGWMCKVFATSASYLYVARTFLGASMGMIISSFPLYIGEISSPQIRGALVGLVVNGIPLGTLAGNIMGPRISMMWFGVIGLILAGTYLIIFPLLPATPHYFLCRNNLDAAIDALKWYHRKADVSDELENIKEFVGESRGQSLRAKWGEIKEPKNRRAFLVLAMMFIFLQLSGLNSVIFYMEIIVKRAGVDCITPSNVVIMINAIGIVFGWIAVYALDHCGRRSLVAISSSGVFVGMMLLGIHFSLLQDGYDPKKIQWLPILSLIMFMLLCVGLVPVPNTMLSELFPSNLKSTAGFVGGATAALFAFLSSKSFQPMLDIMPDQYVFWTYAFIMIVCLVCSMLFVPETKGKTLTEIQHMLARQSLQE